MTYREVESELELIDRIETELKRALTVNKRRRKNNGTIRAWRLNVGRMLNSGERRKRVDAETERRLKAEIDAFNSWVREGTDFVVESDGNAEKTAEKAISRDDVFRMLWEKAKPIREILTELPKGAEEEIETGLAETEKSFEREYRSLTQWLTELKADENRDARAELVELRTLTNDAFSGKVVAIRRKRNESKISLIPDEKGIAELADRLFAERRESNALTEPLKKAFESRKPKTEAEFVQTVKFAVERFLEDKNTEYVSAENGKARYEGRAESGLNWRSVKRTLFWEEEPLNPQIISELESYRRGKYEHTEENADRINEIAEKHGTLAIDIEKGKTSADTKELKRLLKKLNSLAQTMNGEGNSSRGKRAVAMLTSATEEMLVKADRKTKAFSDAEAEFSQASEALRSWVRERWYQFGGTPANHKPSFAGDKSTYVKPVSSTSWQGGMGKSRI